MSWLRDGVPISVSHPRYLILPSGSLRIFGVTLSDSGVYSCEASNPLGSARHPVELSVQGKNYEVGVYSNSFTLFLMVFASVTTVAVPADFHRL